MIDHFSQVSRPPSRLLKQSLSNYFDRQSLSLMEICLAILTGVALTALAIYLPLGD